MTENQFCSTIISNISFFLNLFFIFIIYIFYITIKRKENKNKIIEDNLSSMKNKEDSYKDNIEKLKKEKDHLVSEFEKNDNFIKYLYEEMKIKSDHADLMAKKLIRSKYCENLIDVLDEKNEDNVSGNFEKEISNLEIEKKKNYIRFIKLVNNDFEKNNSSRNRIIFLMQEVEVMNEKIFSLKNIIQTYELKIKNIEKKLSSESIEALANVRLYRLLDKKRNQEVRLKEMINILHKKIASS